MAAIEEEEQFHKLSHFLSTFGNIVAVKSISGNNGGCAMWFSTVKCPRCCPSHTCDNNNFNIEYYIIIILRCIKLLP